MTKFASKLFTLMTKNHVIFTEVPEGLKKEL